MRLVAGHHIEIDACQVALILVVRLVDALFGIVFYLLFPSWRRASALLALLAKTICRLPVDLCRVVNLAIAKVVAVVVADSIGRNDMHQVRIHRAYIIVGLGATSWGVRGVKPFLHHRVLALNTLYPFRIASARSVRIGIERIARDVGVHIPDNLLVVNDSFVRNVIGIPQ